MNMPLLGTAFRPQSRLSWVCPPYGGLARTGLSLLYVRLDGDDGSERNRASWTQIQIRHRIISEGRESGVPSVFLPNSVQLLKAYWVGGDTPEP